MASILKVDKLDPQSGTALEIGTSGDTVTVPSGATLDISSATLTPPATLPASSGVNLTALNATNLGSGTVPTARLGSGTASSTTVLYGDQTYKAEPTGALVKLASGTSSSSASHTFNTSVLSATYDRYKFFMNNVSHGGATGTDNSTLEFRWVVGSTIQTATSFVWAWRSMISGDNTTTSGSAGHEWVDYASMGEPHRFDDGDPLCVEINFSMNPHAAYGGNIVYGTTIGQVTGSHFSRDDWFSWYNTATNKTGFNIQESDGDSFEFEYELYGYAK